MPDEDCPVISPQGKEPLKKLCLWQNNLFLFGSSETLFGCSSVGGKQPAFPGDASLYPSSHPGFCGPRRKGAWLLVWIFQSRAFCNGHSWAKSSKLPLTCVLQTTQPCALLVSVFTRAQSPCPCWWMFVARHTLTSLFFTCFVFQPPKVESLNGLLLGYRIYYRELDYDAGPGTESKNIQNPSALRAELTRKPMVWTPKYPTVVICHYSRHYIPSCPTEIKRKSKSAGNNSGLTQSARRCWRMQVTSVWSAL